MTWTKADDEALRRLMAGSIADRFAAWWRRWVGVE